MANQMTITFNVENQILSRTDTNRIVEKAKNYVNAHFEFNELWDDTTKAILIEGSGLRYKVYLNENNECSIPNRVVRHDGFTLTVVGEDSEKFITITTNDLFIPILSNRVEDSTPRYVEVIVSNTLDVTRNEETYNLEIPDKYLELYVMQENDFSNMEQESGGWILDISEKLESIIRAFEKRISVDWSVLGLTPPVTSATKCIYSPTKKIVMVGDEEITYYIFSAVDSVGDTSVNFYYQNGSWHVIFATGNLVDVEMLNMRLYEKQDVLEAGEGIDISGNVISTTGGGDTLYRHVINETYAWISFVIITKSNTPFTMQTLAKWLYDNGYDSMYNRYTASSHSGGSANTSGVYSTEGTSIKYITSNGQQAYQGTGFVDVISEVQ